MKGDTIARVRRQQERASREMLKEHSHAATIEWLKNLTARPSLHGTDLEWSAHNAYTVGAPSKAHG